jgi:DNA-directed RNA polymerase subunit alpha
MAMVESAKILRKYINPFVQYTEIGDEAVDQEISTAETETVQTGGELAEKLAMSIEQLNLTVRSSNCLESNNVQSVGQLVAMTEADLLKIRSFGKTSLREVRQKLADLGLSLGMTDAS